VINGRERQWWEKTEKRRLFVWVFGFFLAAPGAGLESDAFFFRVDGSMRHMEEGERGE
jgi:hypothetical protein